HLALGEIVEGMERRFGRDTKIAEGARLPAGATGVNDIFPFERNFGRALTRRGPVEAEVGELQPLASRGNRDHRGGTRRTDLSHGQGHAGSLNAIEATRSVIAPPCTNERIMKNATRMCL